MSWDKLVKAVAAAAGAVVEPSHRDLRRAPGFMKDVKSKEMDLRDGGTDCPVRKGTFLLQDIQEFPVQSFRF